jgi:hypothetical protein
MLTPLLVTYIQLQQAKMDQQDALIAQCLSRLTAIESH